MTSIHPTAIISPGAEIDTGVEIGPFCTIGPNVKIAKGNKLISHVVVDGHTTIGEDNNFYSFTSIGAPPQDKTYKGEPTELIIGKGNLFRECVNVHRATTKQIGKTIIGDNNYFMSMTHIAHDCKIGNNVQLASGCACAGHVVLGDHVQMGGHCGVTPFVTLGDGAFIGGASAVDKDIPPYCTAFGNRILLKGVNIVGLKRRGHSKPDISELLEFYRMIESSAYSPRAFVENHLDISEFKEDGLAMKIINFIKNSEIGIPSFMN